MQDTIQSREAQGRVADAPSGHWVYRALPRRQWPYAQLARWDRPIGWWLLLWPCWLSAALAGLAGAGDPSLAFAPWPHPWHLVLFLIGAVAMRGAGCTYNDLVDQKIDEKVARTRSRPLPSGQVTRRQAWVFLVLQALVGFLVLIQFNLFAILFGIASLAVVAVYPFMKRITDWPQLTLGLAFSWGAWMGWAAIFGEVGLAPALLYAGAILWTIGYDTIYAHQDKEDDALVGVRSTALLFGANTKPWLFGLYSGCLVLFAGAWFAAGVPVMAYFGLAAAAVHMLWQIRVLDIDDADQCLKLFKANSFLGWLVFAGLLAAAPLA
ncbi:4-hydroxybenzoate octaprenyltransferase [Oricola sp.]|uniref:4-hydroxybenzoate octaprenyltransferase n=1 Tax=Oricola sp. TaxID=1979950 RepID=UPI0025D9F7E7|nr:4-hydroxybenzoate octaprenyltransferase [Oricola sp.]MCI5076673.1 4-hydroxybenzoate octaprenyltransferase [Oricola sp.]